LFISIYTMADRISYRNLLVGVYEYFQSEMLNKLVANQPKTHLQTICNQMKTKSINYGDIRLNNIRKYLDQFPGYTRCVLCYYFYYFSNCALTFFLFFYRSEMQKKFHESFLQVIICLLYSSFYTLY
jgi:hypothetical protein